MKVFVIGTDKAENHGAIEDALRASGHELVNDVCSLTGVVDKLNAQRPKPDVLLVRADVARREREDEMLSLLTAWPVVVLVPPGRSGRMAALEVMRQSTAPHVRGILSAPPFDFSGLNELCAMPAPDSNTAPSHFAPLGASAPTAASAPTSTARLPQSNSLVPLRCQVRLGFFGQRGGVGVSTTALKVAQAIAARGQRVALFDLTGRGDLHVMLGREPQTQVMVVGSLSLFLGLPSEDIVTGFNAVVLDGGRHVGQFNAQWVEVRKPLTDQAIGRLLDVEKPEPARSLGIGRLVSIEVMD